MTCGRSLGPRLTWPPWSVSTPPPAGRVERQRWLTYQGSATWPTRLPRPMKSRRSLHSANRHEWVGGPPDQVLSPSSMRRPGNARRRTQPLEAALRLLGPLEGRIMRQVWTGALTEPFVVRDVQRLLPDLAYTTLMTTLNRLGDKEILKVA